MCGACHGDLTEHNKKPRTPGLVPITFGKKSAAEPQNEACLACHEQGSRIHWKGSRHETENLSCTSCHSLHIQSDPILNNITQTGMCNATDVQRVVNAVLGGACVIGP